MLAEGDNLPGVVEVVEAVEAVVVVEAEEVVEADLGIPVHL